MGFQLSPGVAVSEIDLTTVVPSVSTTAGAFAGTFQWGPANKIILVDSEITLSKIFGTPDSNSAVSFFTAANFLAYGNNLSVVRAVGTNTFNADANTAGANIQVANKDVFQYTLLTSNNNNVYGPFMARYAGALGNDLSVSVCANTASFSSWAYSSYFPSAPTTSSYVSGLGGSNDELHIVVIDTNGSFSGSKGTVLETFPFVSKALDAVNLNDGSSNYYKQVIFNNSKYIYAVDPVDYANTSSTWGTSSAGKNFATSNTTFAYNLSGGVTDTVTDANKLGAFELFANKEYIDIDLIITGDASPILQQGIIDNVVGVRQDCVAFVSPRQVDVVNQSGLEISNIQNWLNTLSRSSTYAVADSGWKYQFDMYNNTYRWIPLNADVAGLCVYTDSITDPWFSPAGLNRGAIKNAIKLAWNPAKTYRDSLYSAGVNAVVSFPGQGIVLWGDKTLTVKPSAFDRINVRRLFIALEKAISKAAQYSLFELNDDFTRAQFVSLVSPFLRDVQGRRGIVDFKVVCDTTNNTPNVIDSNQFVGDIYIKPARSINYIQLNFVAVGTGVDFNTIVGQATV